MDAGPILEQIKGEILESHLGKELTDKIDLVDGNGPGSVNERVGTAKTELAKQISEVNNALADTKSNLQQQITSVGQSVTDAKAELQQQITAVSTLAGSLPYRKDKTYSINQSALGSDGKLYQALKAVPLNTPPPNATYWTDVGQAVVTANGIAARVSKVETDVSTLDGKTTAQASQIQSLQTSLTATDKNVAKKADATVVDSLTLRVSDAEGKLTSEGKRIDGLQTSLDGKASSTALQQVTSRVTATEQKDAAQDQQLTSQSQALTSLTDSVSKKAEAATVQALSNEVRQQGQDLTAQGQSLTRIDTALPNVGGENLLFNPSFDVASAANANIAAGWYWRPSAGVVVTPTLRNSDLGAEGKCQRLDVSGLTADSGATYVDFVPVAERRPPAFEGKAYTASVYARGNSGLLLQIYLQFKDAAGNTLSTNGPSNLALNPTYQRPLLVSALAPAGSTRVDVLYRIRSNGGSSLTAGFVDFDMAQLEQGTTLTGWRDNGKTNADSIAVNAAATTALTGRVEKAEQGLSSTSSQVTRLENSLTTTNGNVAK
ncbi:hypothetical protein, partial [Brevundimonas sp.]|uniref:hypothetical protein n=1 Tax=Brevundimonas sp. TaxID=1871086 RepID=UPI0028A7686A